MSSATPAFDQLRAAFASGGAAAMLDALASDLRAQGKSHELFEALKTRARWKCGLSLLDATEELPDDVRSRYEDGLLDACREVGTLLLRQGKIREGWLYLRPVGDRRQAAAELAALEVTEENAEEVVEVGLHEGVDPALGFGALLKHHGTCNSITALEHALPRLSQADQQAVVGLLIRRLHGDLLANVRAEIARQEGAAPREATLRELLADRDWLFVDHAYHIDTTHLASTTRFARFTDAAADLRLALDLTEYGRRLAPQFQNAGEPPFSDFYPAHAMYFEALLGEKVETALAYFRAQAEEADNAQESAAAQHVYLDLLARLGRPGEAVGEATRLLRPNELSAQDVAALLDWSRRAGDYGRFLALCERRGDVVSYAKAWVESQAGKKTG